MDVCGISNIEDKHRCREQPVDVFLNIQVFPYDKFLLLELLEQSSLFGKVLTHIALLKP